MEKKWILENNSATLEVLNTGAIISNFHLKENAINPLSFKMETDKNSEQYYKGHFICAGRWGDPTTGEKEKGIHKHGDIFLLNFSGTQQKPHELIMQVESATENLAMKKSLTLDSQAACFVVTETLTNTGSLSRLCNLVQHPTLAAPFLTRDTVVNCNATTGFTYTEQLNTTPPLQHWPKAIIEKSNNILLERPLPCSTGVYSYITDAQSAYGWITAYSPEHQTLLGYIWKRETYPWINHWIHWQDGTILYRGLEFGTTGLHHNYKTIVQANALKMLDETTCFMLDAKESRSFSYAGFLATVPNFSGISDVYVNGKVICFKQKENNGITIIELENSLNL